MSADIKTFIATYVIKLWYSVLIKTDRGSLRLIFTICNLNEKPESSLIPKLNTTKMLNATPQETT